MTVHIQLSLSLVKFQQTTMKPIISIEIIVEKHLHQFLTYFVILAGTLKSYYIISHTIENILIFESIGFNNSLIIWYPRLRVSEISIDH